MNRQALKKLAVAALLVAGVGQTAWSATDSGQTEKTPAFPGAEGFGRYVTGGRGGSVYHVTNLNDSGTGSLRWANSQSGPRTIVFDVSGTIYLKSALKFSPNTTVAGQTAPGDGICVADYPVTIGSNCIVRYMRFRLGNQAIMKALQTYADANGYTVTQLLNNDELRKKVTMPHEGDGLGSMDDNNIIVDHCSVSWSIDECLSIYGGKNLTVQWCISSQSLVKSGHSKGSHGYGGNWGGAGASFHHNLIAHHTARTPRLGPRPGTQTDERMDMRNNVMYNYGKNGCYGGEGMKVNIVNNYYKPGPASDNGTYGRRIAGIGIRTTDYCKVKDSNGNWTGEWNGWKVMEHVWGKYYVTGNVNSKFSDVTRDNWTYGMYNQIDNSKNDNTYTLKTKDTIRINEPIPFVHVTTHTADKAYDQVLKYVGASLHRDALDDIIVSDVRTGKATFTGSGNSSGFINSQEDVKSKIPTFWPELKSETAPKDTDGDGMPDEWELANGLNPADAADGNIRNDEGYTNVELYMNSLVANITAAQNEDGTEEGYVEYATEEDLTGAINIPTDALDLDKANITTDASGRKAAKVLNNSFDSFCHNDQAVFMLNCKEAGTYTISYEAATTRSDFKLSFKLADAKTFRSEATKTQNIVNTGAWQTYRNYSFDAELTEGIKQLTMTWLSSSGQYTGNVKNIAIKLKQASGISSVQTDYAQRPARVYNLQGQQVNHTRPGIYVVNGKKYVVR